MPNANQFIRLPITRKLLIRIFSKIQVSTKHFYRDVACWEWIGALTAKGYGQFKIKKKQILAHRWIYQTFVEEFSVELDSDHLCRRPRCVNPVHIEPVTKRENCLRGESPHAKHARKTHCIKGHVLIQEGNRRRCRQCKNASLRTEKTRVRDRARNRAVTLLPLDDPRRIHKREVAARSVRLRRANQTPEERELRLAIRRQRRKKQKS